jgi:hypothetical protein
MHARRAEILTDEYFVYAGNTQSPVSRPSCTRKISPPTSVATVVASPGRRTGWWWAQSLPQTLQICLVSFATRTCPTCVERPTTHPIALRTTLTANRGPSTTSSPRRIRCHVVRWTSRHHSHPSGGVGQDGSGCHPDDGDHPGGGVGHPGGACHCRRLTRSILPFLPAGEPSSIQPGAALESFRSPSRSGWPSLSPTSGISPPATHSPAAAGELVPMWGSSDEAG